MRRRVAPWLAAALALAAGCRGRFALPADARFVEQMAVSDSFACARMKDGSVRCFGANESGELGDGTLEARPVSVKVALPARATSIAADGRHACAVVEGGDVYCWGANDAGQSGGVPGGPRATPVRIDAARARSLALGARHSCALLDDGAVRCWGASDRGQTDAGRVHGARAIAARGDATCIIDADRRVACWGAVPGRISPGFTPIEGLADVMAIALGPGYGCAVRAWGGVACWGKGDAGQLGDGAFEDHVGPSDVLGLAAPGKSVAGGRAHACAALGDATVRCWGANAASQLADGTRTGRAQAAQVQGVFEAVQIAAGGDATCAVLADGSARCWGGLPLPKTEVAPVAVPTEVRW